LTGKYILLFYAYIIMFYYPGPKAPVMVMAEADIVNSKFEIIVSWQVCDDFAILTINQACSVWNNFSDMSWVSGQC